MTHVHRLHIEPHAGRPVRLPEPLRLSGPVETSADAEIATFLRAFAVFLVVMIAVIALYYLG